MKNQQSRNQEINSQAAAPQAADSRFPNKSLVFGIILFLLGGLLLLWQLNLLPGLDVLWPLPIIILGLFFLYAAFLRGKKRRYILPGMLFTLAGLFFLLLNTVLSTISLEKIWPIFMLITGVSILPYGHGQKKNTRVAILIPALAIVGLAIIFLPFSLRLVTKSFTNFVLTWWPTLLLLTGTLLILSHFMRTKS